jgi:multiple sugar transport system permease protein
VIFSWNNFVFGIVLAGRETRTLPVAVYNMISFDQLSWGPLAAAALIVTLPVLLLTIFAQRQIVAGLTAGAVKGGQNLYTGRSPFTVTRVPARVCGQ